MMGRLLNIWRHRGLRPLLSAYIDGNLTEGELARLEVHLSTCEECRWELESLRATVAMLRKVTAPKPSRSFALGEKPAHAPWAYAYLRTASAAASVAALLLVVLVAGNLTGLLSQQGAAGEAGPAQKVKVTEGDISGDSMPALATAPTPLPSPPPVPAAPAPRALAPTPEPTPQSRPQEEFRKSLTVGEVTPEPFKEASVRKARGLSIPLWQLEVSLGGLAAFLGAASAWMALRSRRGAKR